MNHKQIIYGKRSLLALQLRERGETFETIGKIFKGTKEEGRKLVMRGRYMQRTARTGAEVVRGPDADGWVRNSVTGAGVRYRTVTVPSEFKQLKPCCERDHDGDGNCDRHPNGQRVVTVNPDDGRAWTRSRADAVVDAVIAGSPKDDGDSLVTSAATKNRKGKGQSLLTSSPTNGFTHAIPQAFWPRKGAKD